MFSFGRHMNSYRLTVYGHGAFELCLPSLGFFFTKLSLRCLFVGLPRHMAKVRVGGEPHLQQDAVHTCRVGLYKIYNQYDIEPIR